MSLFDMCCPKKPKKSLDYIIKWIEDADKTFSNINTSIAGINAAISALQGDIKDLEDWKSTIESSISDLVTEAIEDYDWSNLPVEALQTKADKVENAVTGNLASLDTNGNLVDSGKKTGDFVPYVSEGTLGIKAEEYISLLSGDVDHQYINIEIDGEEEQKNPKFTISIEVPEAYQPISKSATIDTNNIDNLNRALEKPDTTPIYGSDKLITSSAVAEGLNRKANSTHTQGIETITGLNAVIASLTERIRALEEQPSTESIQLTGTYHGYNTLLNEDSKDILYSAQSTERKILCNIDTLYDFAEVGSAVALSYTVPNTPSNTIVTFNTVVVNKVSGPSRLVLRDSIPDVQYVNYTDITLTITK